MKITRWRIIIAVILIIAGGVYFAYKKGLIKMKKSKPGPEASSYMPRTKSASTSYKPRMKSKPAKKFIDKELDKSIDELERLLKS